MEDEEWDAIDDQTDLAQLDRWIEVFKIREWHTVYICLIHQADSPPNDPSKGTTVEIRLQGLTEAEPRTLLLAACQWAKDQPQFKHQTRVLLVLEDLWSGQVETTPTDLHRLLIEARAPIPDQS